MITLAHGTAALLALFVWPAHAITFNVKQIDLKPLALQLRSCLTSESMGHHDSEIMDGERVG